jgi:hypothetical protein
MNWRDSIRAHQSSRSRVGYSRTDLPQLGTHVPRVRIKSALCFGELREAPLVIHQEPRTKTGGQKKHAKEGLLIFVTFRTKDIYIQLFHNAQNHAQTLHEAIHGDSQHPVCRRLVFGSQDSLLWIVDEGGILSAKRRGGGNGRKGSAHKGGKFLIDSQGLKRDRRQTCGREGQINGTGVLWSVSQCREGKGNKYAQ